MYYKYDIKKINEAINTLMDLEPSVKHGGYKHEKDILDNLTKAINVIEKMRHLIDKDHEEEA